MQPIMGSLPFNPALVEIVNPPTQQDFLLLEGDTFELLDGEDLELL